MSTRTRNRLPVSIINAVAVGVLLAGATLTALTGRWSEAAPLALAGVIGLAGAVYARRHGSKDITRVNAIEYRDERDRRIAQVGFAAVGAAALALSAVGVLLVALLADQLDWLAEARPFLVGHFLVLFAVWGVSNSVAARRQ